jgi:hypothetical protein
MTTTTPESRARIAYTAYLRGRYGVDIPPDAPTLDELPAEEREGWLKASGVLWDLATTGRATI